MNQEIERVILMILDGWGYAPSWGGNAISAAYTPNFDRLWREYPHSLVHASGAWVGLSGNERGNSEVGHLNLGAGRIVFQDKSYIDNELSIDKLSHNQTMAQILEYAQKNNSNIHLAGLVSYGGIHSHINHLTILLEYFSKFSHLKDKVYIHAFTDGRDSPTHEALATFSHLLEKINQFGCGKIATVGGRYYAMDRDNHWDRTQEAYDAIVSGIGEKEKNPLAAISSAYNHNESDEFITPTVITDDKGLPVTELRDNDIFIYFNFRSDRARQLTLALTKKDFNKFHRKKIVNKLFFVTMVPYGIEKDFDTSNIYSLFKQKEDNKCLSGIISENNLKQLHIAETEKYAHVTYFFNGGQEKPFLGEDRILVNSPRVSTYDHKPQMSAQEIAKKLIAANKSEHYAFSVVNFANADMVGHTGNYQATTLACETVDQEIGIIVKELLDDKTVIIITADHGNAEQMTNPQTGKADTEHTNNLVPLIIVKPKDYEIGQIKNDIKLANIAPSVLKILGIQKSKNMDEALF